MFGAPDAVHKESFLRGGYFTNDDGVVEITTLYPGFYQGRTTHIHAMVHTNWAARDNGTLVSDAGSVNHIGQFFFEESWNDKVFAEEPYKSNTQIRTLNSQDGILQGAGPNERQLGLTILRTRTLRAVSSATLVSILRPSRSGHFG